MTTREFVQHLLLNCEPDDPVHIEIKVPENVANRYISFCPAHASRVGDDDDCVTLIECKPWKEDMD